MLSTRQLILAWSVSQSKPFVLSVNGSCSKGPKQCSVSCKKRPRGLGKFQKVTSEETSSPVAVPTATGKTGAETLLSKWGGG